MKFGVCKTIEYAQQIKDAGFDYIEINLTKISALSEKEFECELETLKKSGLKAQTANCFFPSDIALVGANVDYDKIKQYTEFVLSRAQTMGIEIAVLGSGKSRSVPDGFDRKTAGEQFKKAVEICAGIGKKYGIKVAIEPLSARDSNFLNTVEETSAFCDTLESDNVGIIADFFHMYMNGETMQGFENCKKNICHLHIARPDADRFAPSEKDIDTLRVWAQSIKKIGYDGRMSLENTSKQDFSQALDNMNSVKYIFE